MTDNSNNEVVRISAPDGREAWELAKQPGTGYVCHVGEYEPGPIDSWYGPGERYPTVADALLATE